MPISLIVAMDMNGVIGRDNALPWHLPADLAHFRRVTMGHPIVMGRKTWESIGRPLPGRRSIVVSRNSGFVAEGCEVVRSPDEAFALAADADEVFVIGGAAIFAAALPLARRIHLTRVHEAFTGDTWFPPLDANEYREVSRVDRAPDQANPHHLSFVVLEREASPS